MCDNIELLFSKSKTIFIPPVGNQILANHLSRNERKYSSKIAGRRNKYHTQVYLVQSRIVSWNIKNTNEVPCEISGERKSGISLKLLCQADEWSLTRPWPSVDAELYGRENTMNTHLTNERITYLLLDYPGSCVWNSK